MARVCQEIAEFLTGHRAEVPDNRLLATVLFTDIVDSTRRAAEIGDRDWHALLDAHDTVVRAQLARFRGPSIRVTCQRAVTQHRNMMASVTTCFASPDATAPLPATSTAAACSSSTRSWPLALGGISAGPVIAQTA